MLHLLLCLSLWAQAADAGASPAAASATSCTDPLPALIDRVRLQGEQAAYLCLATNPDAGSTLLTARAAGGAGLERVTRALALWRMQRLDSRIPDDEARAYNADDRRLLRDAVAARRGRASPVPEHARIFALFPWYQPDPSYTNARLTALDKANMALLDSPPKPPVAEKEPAKDAVAEAAPGAPPSSGHCGCGTTGAGASLAWVLAALALTRRLRC